MAVTIRDIGWITEEIEPVPIDASQVATTKRHAVAIEEFENLDGDLPPIVYTIAELCGRKLPLHRRRAKADDDIHHLSDGRSQKEMIVRDFIDLTHAPKQFQHPPHVSLTQSQRCGDVAHARRPEAFATADQWGDAAPDFFVCRCQARLMAGQANPGPAQSNLFRSGERLEKRDECRSRETRLQLEPQPLKPDSGQVRVVGMEAFQRRHQTALEA
jgi:hypothetical protein